METVLKDLETEDEIKGKAYVLWRSWHDTYEGMVDEGFLSALTLEKCTESSFRRTSDTLIALDGDKVTGFLGYGDFRGDDLPGAGEINAIYILSGYRGRGIGRLLMEEALRRLSGRDRVAVMALKGNLKAIGFYEKLGFERDGTERVITLGTPVTEVRLIKKLREERNEKDI